VLVVSVGAALFITPLLALSAVENIGSHKSLTAREKASWGANLAGIDPEAFTEAAQIIPPRARYYIAVTPSLPSFARMSFAAWGSGTLLPRIAVDDPAQAVWIISWGRLPRLSGIRVERARRLETAPRGVPVFVGRIQKDP